MDIIEPGGELEFQEVSEVFFNLAITLVSIRFKGWGDASKYIFMKFNSSLSYPLASLGS